MSSDGVSSSSSRTSISTRSGCEAGIANIGQGAPQPIGTPARGHHDRDQKITGWPDIASRRAYLLIGPLSVLLSRALQALRPLAFVSLGHEVDMYAIPDASGRSAYPASRQSPSQAASAGRISVTAVSTVFTHLVGRSCMWRSVTGLLSLRLACQGASSVGFCGLAADAGPQLGTRPEVPGARPPNASEHRKQARGQGAVATLSGPSSTRLPRRIRHRDPTASPGSAWAVLAIFSPPASRRPGARSRRRIR